MSTETGEHRTIVMHRRRDASSVATPAVGMRLGKYRLCLELASGGMSTVFLARVQDGVGCHRFVALKCLKPRLAEDADCAEMFLDEARVSSLIHHPNVCDVLDFRVQGGVSYMAMELLEGQTLAALLHRIGEACEAWPPARVAAVVARIVADAAEGLHCAHELTDLRGEPLHVVHRDISPENVFLTYDGNVKIIDFGVALTSQQRHHTEPGTFKGKYSYVAPEILRGGKPDRRVDVWGLGMIAWELLAGRRLFEVENEIDVLRAVIDMEIPRPSQVRPGIPPALDDVVMRALDRDPARRYPTARELGRKLTCVLAEERMVVGLGDLAELVAELFPNGRACARQLRDAVERLESAAIRDDTGEHPTVAGPLSGPASSAIAIPTPRIGVATRRALRRPRPRVDTAWLAILSPLVAAAAVVLALAVYAGQREPAPPATSVAPPSPIIDARPSRTRTRAAPATCTPDLLDDRVELQLEPVEGPTGEIVFRVKPVAR
ncbi:MAG TPA: serine/threonine-protein kinase [Kofleriaceae bacterium]|nr:serine/threonine-protein kinase [Kofleriaceae bacterium]